MVSKEAVLEMLRTINDPEMPISIVDLGIVEDVRVEPAVVRCHIDRAVGPDRG